MVNFDPRTENKSMSVLTPKPSQFLPYHKNKSISIPTLKTSQSCMPPDTKTKLISIQTLNQVIFDPHTKPSQFWSLLWNQVNSDTPRWNHVYFDHPHTKSISMSLLKPCLFRAVLLCVLYISAYACSCDTYNIITSTNSYYSWRLHTTVNPRK